MPIRQPEIKPLTKAEKEVLRLITEEFLTLKQIQLRRQCSRQAVYKIFRNLKRKGALNNGLQKVDKIEGVVNQRLVRLHGQEFNIKILFQDHNYQNQLKKSNIIYLSGHTIRLYKNSIEVYSGEGTSFYGDDAEESFRKSLIYWKKFFTSLEHELKVILIKPRARNVRIVNQHFARGDSEVCENAIKEGDKIKVFAAEDGKLAFITDDSFGFREDETVHPKTSKPDREEIDKHINDWRLHKPPTNSQLATHIIGVVQNQEYYAEHIKSHVKSVQDLGAGVSEMVSLLKEMREEFKKQNGN